MKKWLYLVLATVLLAGAFGISGCGGTNGSPFLDMLKLIPDAPSTRYSVYISDHARIRELYDVPLPSPDADDEEIEDYIMMLIGDAYKLENDPTAGRRFASGSFISGMGPFGYQFASPIRRQNIGFGPQDVDVDISAAFPPQVFEAIKGSFDLSVIEDALSQYDESVMPEISSYQGTAVYDFGPDIHPDRRLSPPAFDQIGRGCTIAVQEEYVFRGQTIDAVEVMIDLSQGRETPLGLTSLADNPDFSLMATALSEMGAYSCFLTDQVMCVDDETLIYLMAAQMIEESDMSLEELVQQIKDDIVAAAGGGLLSVFRTYATGIGEDDEGPFMTIVFIYDSPELASSDIAVFEQRIENGVSLCTGEPWWAMVDNMEVWAEGRSLRAKLYGDIASIWFEIVNTRDTLLWCGE